MVRVKSGAGEGGGPRWWSDMPADIRLRQKRAWLCSIQRLRVIAAKERTESVPEPAVEESGRRVKRARCFLFPSRNVPAAVAQKHGRSLGANPPRSATAAVDGRPPSGGGRALPVWPRLSVGKREGGDVTALFPHSVLDRQISGPEISNLTPPPPPPPPTPPQRCACPNTSPCRTLPPSESSSPTAASPSLST